ncbi:MAG: ACT domain-containing protein [Candidatus Competibacteraceae bacterium]|nr:ACT domain-containing protein [Candidatus Competibacteraceae bacterium]
MTISLVLTIIGPDRPGLVDSLARVVADHRGNWLESRMASLDGQFAGILRVALPDSQAQSLTQALKGLEGQGLKITLAGSPPQATSGHYRNLRLELVGQDRPGIVRDIARVLADGGVSIDELDTAVFSGSMSGENLFRATARLRVPKALADEQLRWVLEELANELMVDIELEDWEL